MRFRFRYWSCSKFADFIRGEKKPPYLPFEEWGVWRNRMKKERPFRYYLSDTLLNKIQDVVYFPYDVYHSVRMRFLNRNLYLLDTGLPKGEYYDLDTRILYACFNEFSKLFEYNQKHFVLSDSDQDLKELYEWWTKTRPNRSDPIDSITKETHGEDYFMLWIDEIEQEYYKEDTEKLKQLMGCRERLWT